MNKIKTINDPIHGLITLPYLIIYDLLEHPIFQRLRRIYQLGTVNMVYPGANHTRFQHAIGCMHLMKVTLDVLKMKGVEISDEEREATMVAILLHDLGHIAYSHALEKCLIPFSHEHIGIKIIEKINKETSGKLNLALSIFKNEYPKKFLYQLISSPLDLDRLDYIKRDSYFTGVAEGAINVDRIIFMLNVLDQNMVVEEKGIYSVYNFLIARDLMHWQVYFHKTVMASQFMLRNIIRRVKELVSQHKEVFLTQSLKYFLTKDKNEFSFDDTFFKHLETIDDVEIFYSIKQWKQEKDDILSLLSQNFLNRKLYKVKYRNEPFDPSEVEKQKNQVLKQMNLDPKHLEYFFSVQKNDHCEDVNRINILSKDGRRMDPFSRRDVPYISNFKTKYYMYYFE